LLPQSHNICDKPNIINVCRMSRWSLSCLITSKLPSNLHQLLLLLLPGFASRNFLLDVPGFDLSVWSLKFHRDLTFNHFQSSSSHHLLFSRTITWHREVSPHHFAPCFNEKCLERGKTMLVLCKYGAAQTIAIIMLRLHYFLLRAGQGWTGQNLIKNSLQHLPCLAAPCF